MENSAPQNQPRPDDTMNPQDSKRYLALKEEELNLKRKELDLRAQELALRNKRILVLVALVLILCLILAVITGFGLWFASGKKLPFQSKPAASRTPTTRPLVPTNTSVPATPLPMGPPLGPPPPRPSPSATATATATEALPTATATASIPTPTPLLVEPTESLLPFKDNFNSGISSAWQNVSSEYWGTMNGRLISLKGYNDDDAFDHAMWIGAEDWQNYTVEMDWVSKKYYGDCHLYLAVNPNTRYDALNIILSTPHEDANHVNLIWSTTPHAPFSEADMPFRMKAVLQGSLVTVYVNGKAINQISLPGYDHGQIGLSCTSEETQIDNFRVTESK